MVGWWLRQRKRLDKASRPTADAIFLLIIWNLWKHRNTIVFHRCPSPDLLRLRADTVREAEDQVEAGYLLLRQVFQAWSHSVSSM